MLTDKTEDDDKDCDASALLYAMHYENDARNSRVDISANNERLKNPRQNVVQFLQSKSLSSSTESSSFRMLIINALPNISVQEKLLVRYGCN